MRFTIFLSNFAATLFLVEVCEAVYTLNMNEKTSTTKVKETNKASQDAKAFND